MCLFQITVTKLPDGKSSSDGKMQIEVHGVAPSQMGTDLPDPKTAEFTEKLASFQVLEYSSYLVK